MLNKKIIAKLLVFTMILSMLPFSAFAADGNAAAEKAGEQPNSSAYALIVDTVTVTGGMEGETPVTLSAKEGSPYELSADVDVLTPEDGKTVTVEFSVNDNVVNVYRVGNDAVNLIEGKTEKNVTDTIEIAFDEATEKTETPEYVVCSEDGNATHYKLSFTVKVAYTVTVSEAENGTVEASTTAASAGTEITLTVKPATDYELATLTVDDTDVAADVQEDGTYTFTMPANNVVVTATFKQTTSESTYTITVNAQPAEGGSAVANVATAKAGEKITLTVTPKDSYELDTFTFDVENVSAELQENGTYTFTMPASDVVVTANFKQKSAPSPEEFAITVKVVGNGTAQANPEKAVAGADVTITATPTDEEHVLQSIAVNGTNLEEGVTTFKMPAEAVEVVVSFKEKGAANYNVDNKGGSDIDKDMVPADIPSDVVNAVEKSSIELTETATALNVAHDAATDKTLVAKMVEKLGAEKADDIEFVTKPVIEMLPTAYTAGSSPVLTMNITGWFKVYAQRKNHEGVPVYADRSEKITEETIVVITVALPETFHAAPHVFARNMKRNYQYKAMPVGPKGSFSFRNHGFSPFEFGLEDNAVVSSSSKPDYDYLDFDTAASEAKKDDLLTIMQDYDKNLRLEAGVKVQLKDEVKFTGTINGVSPDFSSEDGVYVVPAKSSSGNSSSNTGSSGGGGGSSKPSITSTGTKDPTDPVTPGSTGTDTGFGDVAPTAWYAESVKYVVDRGLFGGVGGGKFAPESNMTRAMMWTVLARYKGVNTDTGATWYEAARTWAIEQNISDGTMADGNVTREQFVTMLWRLSGEPAASGAASFTDNGSVSAYAKTAVDWAVSLGIVNGYSDGSFKPQGSATRAEVAKMLTVFCITTEG